ncbi:MAG: MarR family winged helix-turn-helix transcriptional regulator [Desulfobacterales bacterium]|nr:MarR family winged helix-turn-helix transcriptional regulator [Desulfobacterales bacterium]
MPEEDAPLLEDAVLREVGALTRTIHAIIEIQFKGLNLQKGQSIYLTRICENPGITMKELSRLLAVDKTTASKVVKKLADEKLVRKARDPADRRARPLYPTEKAAAAYRVIIEEENRLTRQCYAGFTPDEQAAVLDMITRMRQNIEADWCALKNYIPPDSFRKSSPD